MITAILTIYNRSETLLKQIECLNNQTIKPQEIWIWKNKGSKDIKINVPENVKFIESNFNFKYHSRFALAQLVRTEYVAIIDDDIFPQKKWFENCINSIKKNDGIMCAMGVELLEENYRPHKKYGWCNILSEDINRVDIGCQSWFFKKKHLKFLWMEEPLTWDNGEDIQFSYLAKKYGNINTYVPPHPQNNKDGWGSEPFLGNKYGSDNNATYRINKNHFPLRDMLCNNYIKNGWRIKRIEKL